jgi:Polyketide cyclase / dehydrase and lipid transport
MSGIFIFMTPILVGVITVYVAETIERRSWFYYFWAPFVANVFFILGTLAINVEGLICAIVILPMFALIGAMGGLAMGVVCRITHWPKQTVYALAMLPIALVLAGDHIPTPTVYRHIERSIVVHAPPAVVWENLNRAINIQQRDFSETWAAKIGVPMPESGTTEMTQHGRMRKMAWGKGVRFTGEFTDWQPERYMRWNYRFAPDSFPAHSLDDHVQIGGHYFDLRSSSYRLTPMTEGTRLDIDTEFRITTQFNFYADAVANLMLEDMLDALLIFFQRRSELASKQLITPDLKKP